MEVGESMTTAAQADHLMGHSEPKDSRPTISELAEDLIETEKEIVNLINIRDERKIDLEEAKRAFDEADRKVDSLCRRRNSLIKELSKYEMIEYEGDDK